MAWSRQVFSSMVSEVGWQETSEDGQLGDLLITWQKGRRSAYADVPESVADQLARAPSVGQFVNMEIKPFYSHRYV